ncbi:hypothetical protein [Bacillus sp. 03113]|uniref:hypothetical protein n=1 Tax=Bacillus sp. 03113 TaxID=2578211 RepID=UPI001144BA8B|nr:hypothetical protein [Bacillus sp. 03113]
MKVLYLLLILLGIVVISGCQLNQGETMVLLDEKVKKVEVSKSNGVGDINQDIMLSFDDKQSIKIFEGAIRTATKQESAMNVVDPDFDLIVGYGDKFPKHAIHLWLGNENESSILMYMVGEGETYLTSSKFTNQLRELILSEE